MSLLIKALDKAEKAQEETAQAEALATQKNDRRSAKNIVTDKVENANHPHNLTQEFYSTQYAGDISSARASNVFDAKQLPINETNPMVWIMSFGALALLGIGAYFYYQLNQLESPSTATLPTQSVVAFEPKDEDVAANERATSPVEIAPSSDEVATEKTSDEQLANSAPKTNEINLKIEGAADPSTSASNTNVFKHNGLKHQKSKVSRIVNTESTVISSDQFESNIASDSASIKIVKTKKDKGIHPELMDAYNAYNQGKDVEAQLLYRRVLQKDSRNADALLGMGAIAERQGRESDALNWYQKVLEVEPRNTVALSAFYDQQLQSENKEQKLKGLIAKEPNSPNAHADLAGYYAEQQNWAMAQQSFFEAFRLNPTAENALNLAVSLDQMGKSNLALNYYQQALGLSNNAHQPSGINQAEIRARVDALRQE
jgi:Flp pilus assembly protein TadD